MSESDDPFRPLFASDLAMDIRSEFFEHVGHGLSASSATAHVFDRFRDLLTDPDDGPVIIVCIATMQMQENSLDETMRNAAIDLIESGEASASWKTASSRDSLNRSANLGDDRDKLLLRLAEALREAPNATRFDDVETNDQ